VSRAASFFQSSSASTEHKHRAQTPNEPGTNAEVITMEQLQILIADDSEFMRIAYKRILESQSTFRVVAMASTGEEAVQKAAESAPDVAI